MIHLAIADNQTLFRQALCLLLKHEKGLSLDVQAENGQQLLQLLGDANKLPDIALIDIDMPEMTGIELNHQLQKYFPSIKVITLSIFSSPSYISKLIGEGICAYLIKNCDKEELVNAINTVHCTGFYANHQSMLAVQYAALLKKTQSKNLSEIILCVTKREKQVLEMICCELSTAEIADKLYLSIRTVEGHRKNLLLKTGSHNTAGLVLFAVKTGLFNIGI